MYSTTLCQWISLIWLGDVLEGSIENWYFFPFCVLNLLLKDTLKMWMRLKEGDGVNLQIKKLDKMRGTTQSRKWGNLKGSEGTPSFGMQVFWLVYNILYDKPMAQETFHIWNSTVHKACIFVVIVEITLLVLVYFCAPLQRN